MLSAAVVATSLAVVPMVERCRSALMQFSFFPEAKSDVRLQVSEDGWIAVGPPVELLPADMPPIDDAGVALLRSEPLDAEIEPTAVSCDSEIVCAQPLRPDGLSSPHDAMDADAADVMPTVGCPPDAERQLAFSYVVSPIREAVPRLPPVVAPDPCAMPSNALATAILKMTYDALSDGSVNARASKWRLPLVEMLVGETAGTDFDGVYELLLRSFPGNDKRMKIRALAKWADANLPPCEAADVYRAETRYWLNVGEPAMTADAAGRMERARHDYAVRACRLRALSHAMVGDFDKARAEIARSRGECDPPARERLELLYLEAWIWLQEGRAEAARRNLQQILAECPRGAIARRAGLVLQSISKETR